MADTDNSELPEHWILRIENGTPLTEEEIAQFVNEAGPHLQDWIEQIKEAAQHHHQEAQRLLWESRILRRLGYFDADGTPQMELHDQFYNEDGLLKPALFDQHQDLKPQR